MPTHANAPILVSGASGKLGQLVLQELVAHGATRVTAGSRKGDAAVPAGVRTAKVDFDDPASLDAAFAGIERLLIISTDALGEPGKRLAQHRAAVAAAARAGVRHVVYTSMPAPEPGSAIPFAPDHLGSEAAIKASGLAYTILRNNWYFENLLMGMPQAIASGTLYTSAGDGAIAHVARADCARAAAAALLNESTSATYDITGAEAFTRQQQVDLFNRTLGTDVKVVQIPDEALAGGARAAGVPEIYVGIIVGTDANARIGRMGKVSGDVEKLTGRAPERLADWLAVNKGLFQG